MNADSSTAIKVQTKFNSQQTKNHSPSVVRKLFGDY